MKLSNLQRLLAGAGLLLAPLFAQHSLAAPVKGADVSWTSQIEDNGYKYYNRSGVQKDVFAIMKEQGMTAVRLRVWVNPADGWYNGTQDVVAKARRVKAAGLKLMVDFHYSDTWADPGKQTKPAAWRNYTFQQLMDAVWNSTRYTLQAIKDAGVTVDWVQVGNETNNGMLWDDGKASVNMRNYAWLTNTGYNAVKSIYSGAKVIVHLANCHDNANFRWIFDGLRNNGAQFDIIGASNYPTNAGGYTWQNANTACLNNLNDMVSRYGVPVMITEIGVPWDHSQAYTIVKDMVTKVGQVSGGKGAGIFYWEPQARPGWQGYTLGAMDNNGKATAVWDAFK
ncbi:glycoside hydrolase family 53 protein [Cellvibrio japonicus]|uniref:Arabinogalactan endo-beta-1,4-galactanase n=1 Tax=Cellvibrio japonicus (strain Ueda107) TaxID=498211 RepID=B3PIY0_CELJU|nr:glycosyl hydrolase 53 family protein [Cellvibrio japonicus]ACE85511.1 arabinogalactan endo-1,4-beta-galactosidase, putative, gal53A [Cellvibrio japonicus Ueda107]QEI11189.1 arabinogalactan endo-1,4-beta-galactosidase [Cellvibrio japonicus]QEI14763.1 arabinogalactan endo-1,4-beta-galactosidase [Cellvibrio japonicus]QEI18343.1 arabinogalactan endo-1,4-beta-galactosidase [Cellvibrio japonicus]